MNKELAKFEAKIGIKFKDKNLLNQVFVHRSYLNEHPGFSLSNNERLEFLGDAVLELITTEYLYLNYDQNEGKLTNWRSALVKGKMLSQIAQKIGLNKYMMLSHGEANSTGKAREYILANALEALIGAIYLDKGYKQVQKFIMKYLLVNLEGILKHNLFIDSKSELQEKVQAKLSITPAYRVLKEWGPDHAKQFEIGVYFESKLIAKGSGESKQEAQQNSACNALKNVKI